MELALFPVWDSPAERKQELAACAQVSVRCGLPLTEEALSRLWGRRGEALRRAGRVEFGESVLPELVRAFCDSPWVDSGTWEETLGELLELFYQFKNDFPVSDDRLLSAMRRVYDGPAHGTTELLADRLPEYLTGEGDGHA